MNTNKVKKERAPQSQLQRANGEAQWAIHFSLQKFPLGRFKALMYSKETVSLVEEYNELVDKLRASIKSDYDFQAYLKLEKSSNSDLRDKGITLNLE